MTALPWESAIGALVEGAHNTLWRGRADLAHPLLAEGASQRMNSATGNSGDMLYSEARDRARRAVAAVLKVSGLHVRELTYELVITNPRDPEKGQIHVAYEDGFVSWERVVWDHWGKLESYAGASDRRVSVAEIIKILTGAQ